MPRSEKKSIEIEVNGYLHQVNVGPDTPLLYVLRNDLGLKGTKFGCGAGDCGACAVLVDGRRSTSCTTPIWEVSGKKVSTVEGLSEGGVPHPIQRAFIQEAALQCGYCTNGIIMTAVGFLRENPNPTADQVKMALDSNLCRCAVHGRIVKAVLSAARILNHET